MTQHKLRRQSVRTMVTAPDATAAPTTSPPPIQTQETPTTEREAPATVTPPPAPSKPERLKLGWPVRADLIKRCKHLAIETGRHDYEVLEDLLEDALNRRDQSTQ